MMNEEQITTGKSRLRGQIKELERELQILRSHPLRRQFEEQKARNEALAKKLAKMETLASTLVDAAIDLAREITELGGVPDSRIIEEAIRLADAD